MDFGEDIPKLKVDSAADCHIVKNPENLTDLQSCNLKIKGIANVPIHIQHQGTLELNALNLKRVRVSPVVPSNIFSVLAGINQGIIKSVVLEERRPRIHLSDDHQIDLIFDKRSGWFYDGKAQARSHQRKRNRNQKPKAEPRDQQLHERA